MNFIKEDEKRCINCKYSAIDIFEEATLKCVNEDSSQKEKVVRPCDFCELFEGDKAK